MQSVGMLQSNIWVALAKEGVGASLQHYSNLIEDQVRTVFKVPEEWSTFKIFFLISANGLEY